MVPFVNRGNSHCKVQVLWVSEAVVGTQCFWECVGVKREMLRLSKCVQTE